MKDIVPPVPEGFIDSFKKLKSMLSKTNQPDLIEFGQLWRINLDGRPSRIVVISDTDSNNTDRNSPAEVSVCPLNFNFPEGIIHEKGIVLMQREESELSMEALIENWNEIVVLASSLSDYIGCVSGVCSSRLKRSLSERIVKEICNSKYKMYIELCKKNTRCLYKDFNENTEKALISQNSLPDNMEDWFVLPANELLPLSGASLEKVGLLRFYFEKLFKPCLMHLTDDFKIELFADSLSFLNVRLLNFVIELGNSSETFRKQSEDGYVRIFAEDLTVITVTRFRILKKD